MTVYNNKTIKVGDKIRSKYDSDTEWGTVYEVDTTVVRAHYSEDDFEVDYEDIVSVFKPTSKPKTPKSPSKFPSTPEVPDGVMRLTAKEQEVTVKPGTIVTIALANGKPLAGLDKDRLWVVLAFTKNSQRQKVNVYPVNGPQGSETYNYRYHTIWTGSCKPVLFGAYVKITKESK